MQVKYYLSLLNLDLLAQGNISENSSNVNNVPFSISSWNFDTLARYVVSEQAVVSIGIRLFKLTYSTYGKHRCLSHASLLEFNTFCNSTTKKIQMVYKLLWQNKCYFIHTFSIYFQFYLHIYWAYVSQLGSYIAWLGSYFMLWCFFVCQKISTYRENTRKQNYMLSFTYQCTNCRVNYNLFGFHFRVLLNRKCV